MNVYQFVRVTRTFQHPNTDCGARVDVDLAGMSGVVIGQHIDGCIIVLMTAWGTPAWIPPDCLRPEHRRPMSVGQARHEQRMYRLGQRTAAD
jgi:hypothetical protein